MTSELPLKIRIRPIQSETEEPVSLTPNPVDSPVK